MELGTEGSFGSYSKLSHIDGDKLKQVKMGSYHTAFLYSNGEVFTSG